MRDLIFLLLICSSPAQGAKLADTFVGPQPAMMKIVAAAKGCGYQRTDASDQAMAGGKFQKRLTFRARGKEDDLTKIHKCLFDWWDDNGNDIGWVVQPVR